MRKRLIELVALGPELRDEAVRQGKGVNESYLAVHRVLVHSFREDPAVVPSGESLRAYMRQRLQETLKLSA